VTEPKEVTAILTEIIVILALILANGVFAGAEIAIVSLRRSQIQAMLEAKRSGAQAVATLRQVPERFLATVQIGITIVGTAAAAYGGYSVAGKIEPWLAGMPVLGAYAHKLAIALVILSISYLSLVLGELVPKSLALRVNELYAQVVARPLLALSWLTRPLVWFLTASSNLVLRPFSDRTTFTEARLSKEELQHIVDEAAKTGALDEHTSELTARALEFDRLTAADMMVPRNRIVALSASAPHGEIKRCLLEERRSRMPVFEGTLDNVIGYITAKDILPVAWEGRLVVLRDVLRPVRIVTQSTPAVELLRVMQDERQRLAIVVDEHGGVVGLVTFEDVVEELVGEVFSEDEEVLPAIVQEPAGTLLVRGDVALRDVNRELDIDLEPEGKATTLAALCIELAGGALPQRGARLAANNGVVLQIVTATPRAVRRVRVMPPPRPFEREPTEQT
jgi:putative hemolysin